MTTTDHINLHSYLVVGVFGADRLLLLLDFFSPFEDVVDKFDVALIIIPIFLHGAGIVEGLSSSSIKFQLNGSVV